MGKEQSYYEQHSNELTEKYESVSPQHIHSNWLHLLPPPGAHILDIGCGSGRDAAFFASKSHKVDGVDSSLEMLKSARRLHAHKGIFWSEDSLPNLAVCKGRSVQYDLILMNAVWMHVPKADRDRAMNSIVGLLRPGGKLVFTLRYGPSAPGQKLHSVDGGEFRETAFRHGLFPIPIENPFSRDSLGREGVVWETQAFRKIDSGEAGLSLIQNIIHNDTKTATYKLGLLRALTRIANGAAGFANAMEDNDKVIIPAGLVGLYWIKNYYNPVLQGLPQIPTNMKRSFLDAIDALREKNISGFDLQVGFSFQDNESIELLTKAIHEAARLVREQPVHHTHHLNTPEKKVFSLEIKRRSKEQTESELIDKNYLESFGRFVLPKNIWLSLVQFGSWVEPIVILEWKRMMRKFATKKAFVTEDILESATEWFGDSIRTTAGFHDLLHQISETTGISVVECVWSGKNMQIGSKQEIEADHAIPFSRWMNNDLWNLLPTCKTANGSKNARVPSDNLLNDSKKRIIAWWTLIDKTDYSQQFRIEALAALPYLSSLSFGTSFSLDDLFDGFSYQIAQVRKNLQIEDWEPKGSPKRKRTKETP